MLDLRELSKEFSGMLTRNELMGHFSQMGVAGGITVIVHSSYKALGGVEGGPQTVIDVLVELVTPEGTVLFPTFNFSAWTEGHYFDIEHTPSEVGIITELARVDDRFRRTLHPVDSFAVFGSLQETLTEIDSENCLGEGTVFEVIQDNDALMLSLGADFNSTFTLTHHVEKTSGAAFYRYDKSFSGIYIGYDRLPEIRTYWVMVRDLMNGYHTDIIPAMTKMVDDGVISEYHINDTLCHYAYAQEFADSLTRIVRESPEMLFRKREFF